MGQELSPPRRVRDLGPGRAGPFGGGRPGGSGRCREGDGGCDQPVLRRVRRCGAL